MTNAVIIGIMLIVAMGIALLYHVIVKVTPEEGFASSVMTILLLIYIAGMLGNTQVALWIIYVVSSVGIILSVIKWMKKDAYSLKTFCTPGIVMIGILVAFAVVAFHGLNIYNWDELYQWGKAANYMVEHDCLPSGADFSGETVLLSSTTFFHYFMSDLSASVIGTITESNYYVSNLLLWFCAILLPFSGDGWKSWKRIFSFGLFHFLLSSLIFVQPYYNIYTDQATAYWAGGVIAWLLEEKCNKRNLYLIPFVLINVGLMKSMVGPLFAFIVVMSVIVLYVTNCKEKGKRIISSDWKRVLFSKKGLFGTVAVLSPLVLIGGWSLITSENGLFRYNGGVVNPGEEDRAVLTLKSMIGWIMESVTLHEEQLYLSYGVFFLITVAIVYILYPLIMDKRQTRRYQNLMRVYITGFALYFVIMFVAYMMVFGYVDSTRAMSLNRYFSDYMMLGAVPLSVPLFQWTIQESNNYVAAIKKTLIVIFTICILYGSSEYFLQNLTYTYAMDTKSYAEREKMIGLCDEIEELTNGTGKIYFINQKKSGLFTLVADYELDEQLSRNGMCYKFRQNTSESILGLTEYPIETLPQILQEQGYSYVWIYSSNAYLEENMDEIFGIEDVSNGDFYQVEIKDNTVGLSYLESIR